MPEKQAAVQVSEIDFDTDNPRIKKAIEKYGGRLTPQQIHFALRSAANGPASSFSSLKDSIRASKGILSPITLIRRGGRYICIDGNTRLAIYREFDKENVAGDWSRIKSLIIEGATQPDIEMRRVSAHLVGAREWPAYEKARYLHYLRNEKLWDYGRLIELCGGNKAEIERQIDAYHDMNEFYRDVVDDTAFQIDRFSGFVELQKPRVKQAIFRAGLGLEDFGEWIRDGKIYRLEDTRKLPQVLADDQARNHFLSGGSRSIEEAVRSLERKRAANRNTDKLLLKDASITDLADTLAKRIDEMPYSQVWALRTSDREESREQVAALHEVGERLGSLLEDVAK